MPTTRGAHRDFAALEARRFQAAQLFGRGASQVTVARALGVSRTTTLWTLPRIAAVIARRTGVRYHPAHVWRILQGLNWSLQRPARQARERDEAAIGQWRRRRWPQVKKTRGAGTPG